MAQSLLREYSHLPKPLMDRYYIFGFLFLVFVILIITCAEITIVMCYFQLCSEDYHWWWRAYLTSGSCALYLFLYSVFYFATRLELTRVTSAFLFFGYAEPIKRFAIARPRPTAAAATAASSRAKRTVAEKHEARVPRQSCSRVHSACEQTRFD